MVVGFAGGTDVELHVPCTYDLDVAAAKYFHALGDGEIPLILLFSGTVFAKGDGGALRVTQIPWDREARLRLPVADVARARSIATSRTAAGSVSGATPWTPCCG